MTPHAPDSTLREAVALMRSNRLAEARTMLGAACRGSSPGAEHWFLFGAVQHMLGSVQDALSAFERALLLQPDHVNALNARASLLAALGRNEEALVGLQQAIAAQPRNVDAHVNVALLLEAAGAVDTALSHYTTAIAIDPHCRAARLNRSALHLTARRFDAALADTDVLLRVDPRDMPARCNAAKALLGLDRYAEVVAMCHEILRLDTANAGAHLDLGVALACLARFDEARTAFDAGRAANLAHFAQLQEQAWQAAGPDLRQGWTHRADEAPDPRAIYLSRGADRIARCDWHGRDAYLSDFETLVRSGVERGDPICDWSLPFASMWLPLADDVRREVARAVCKRVDAGVARLHDSGLRTVRRPGEPLRIGYVSPKFRNHPGATLCPPILEQHDRTRVSVYGYALNPYDAGALAERFRRSCDHVRECWGRDDASVAQQIRADGIHVLIDVGGYTDYARPEIFAQRPAPVQIAYLGFMSSMAATWIDYFVTDRVATPPAHASQWQERLAYLPRTLLCYDPPPQELPRPPARAQCGLPERGFVFCCFNNPYKIEPRAFRIWMRLLHRVPGSVLWLLREPGTQANLCAAARAHGIDPQRLVFADRIGRAEHLARQQHADLFLDSFEYNAHTTAAEAYYVGLPVLTLPGRTTVARCGASIAHGVGMADLIARDEADYEHLALRCANEPSLLSDLKRRLGVQRALHPLFDAASLARTFEAALEHMWARHEAGLAPTTFAVAPEALGKPFDCALIDPFVSGAD